MFSKDNIFRFFPVALTICLGTVAIVVLGPDNDRFGDGGDYMGAARMILEKGTYPQVCSLPFFRPPLYPLFIASIWSVFPGSILALKISEVLLNGVTCWIIFRTAERITANRITAFVAATLFAVNPFFIVQSVATQSENLQIFLISLAMFILAGLILSDKMTAKAGLGLGLIFGLAALSKPSALGVGLFLAVVLFLLRFRHQGVTKAVAAMVLGIFLAILPWSFYNLKTTGEFILVNDAGGYNLWFGNIPESARLYKGPFEKPEDAGPYQDYLQVAFAQQQIDRWEQTGGYGSLSLKGREALWRNKAVEIMVADPAGTLKLFAWKFVALWRPFLNPVASSAKTVILSGLFLMPLYLFGFIGIFRMSRKDRTVKIVWLFAALAAIVTVIHVILVSSIRLRLPYIDPMLTIFAGIGLGSMLPELLKQFAFLNFSRQS
ncbi:hypothetical protein BH10ACI2_BH10ACI2_15220 [soil metagenome]